MKKVVDFLWPIWPEGYHWVQAGDGKYPVDAQPKAAQKWELRLQTEVWRSQPRWYSPLYDATGLFRTFAGLSTESRDDALQFANAYGQLGTGRPPTVMDIGPFVLPDPSQPETWSEWARAIEQMKMAARAWDMLVAKDWRGLSEYLTRERNTQGYVSRPGPRVKGVQWLVLLADPSNPADVMSAASQFVAHVINDNLGRSVSPQVRYDIENGKHDILLVPQSLLSAMWLQFAQAVAGGLKYRACKECGKWFELSTDDTGFRVSRVFCSDPCKSKDYRKRKEQAQRLKAEGKTVSSIAKELGTDPETVKKWVAKRKG
jgi:hypothetical protein